MSSFLGSRARWLLPCVGASLALALTALSAPVCAEDDARIRGGVSLDGAILIEDGVLDAGPGVSGRLGAQIDDRLAIYAQPSLTLGVATPGVILDLAAIFDVTLADRVALGAGGGFVFGAISRNDFDASYGSFTGGALHGRVAVYPLMVRSEGGGRQGLGISLSLRAAFAFEPLPPLLTPVLGVGYEAF